MSEKDYCKHDYYVGCCDQCKIDQLQTEIDKKNEALEYIDGKLYSIIKTPKGFKRQDLLADAKKAKCRAEQALKGGE